MASTARQIADKVLSKLQSASFSKSIEPELRVLPPRFKAEELQSLKVLVVPSTKITEQATRSGTQDDYGIDIGVMKLIDPTDVDEFDELLGLVEEITDHLKNKDERTFELDDGTAVAWVSTEQDPLYWPEHLEQYNTFVAAPTLTYRTIP